MNLDLAFICCLIKQESLSVVVEENLTEEMLFDESKKAFAFIQEFFPKHGKMPDADTIEQNIGEAFREPTPEPLTYYMGMVKKRWKGNTLNRALMKASEVMVDKSKGTTDPDASIGVLKDAIQEIATAEGGAAHVGLVDLRTNTDERWDDYQRVKSLHGQIDGYPFPWPAFNEASMGVHPGELWIVVARTKMGKSWVELALAHHFLKEKLTVLLVSMEMSIPQMTKRFDAIDGSLPYGDFKRGRMDLAGETKLSESLKKWTTPDHTPFWVCGKGRVTTAQDLELLVEEVKPDIVLIDGVYLMKAGSGSVSKWEKVSAIADDLQDLGLRRMLPIFATSQFGRKVKREKLDAGTEDIGFALELAQNCHGLVGLFQTEEMRSGKEMLVRILELREGEPVNIHIHWDFTSMDFGQKAVVQNLDLVKDDADDSRIQY